MNRCNSCIDLEGEIWLEIEITNGDYSISNKGRVRSNDRIAKDGRKVKGRVLKTYKIQPRGYHTVVLMLDGKKKHFLLHRLVYCTFNNIDIYSHIDVDHADNDPDNNCLENLEGMTHQENMLRSKINRQYIEGYIVPEYIGSISGRNGNSKEIIQADLSGEIVGIYTSIVEAERITGISKHNISRALRGLFKTSGGFYWRYK